MDIYCIGCIWRKNCMFSGKDCAFYNPDHDFEEVDYIADMADRLWDYYQMCEEYSDGNYIL